MTTWGNRTTSEETRITVDVYDAPPMKRSYAQRLLLPIAATVTFRRRDGGRWTYSGADVRGYLAKKNGTAGADSAKESFYRLADAPAWVQEMAAALNPEVASRDRCDGLGTVAK